MRGRYQAVFSLAWQAAGMAAPVIGGLGIERFGNLWWAVAFAIGLIAAVGNLAAGPSRDRRLAEIAAAAKARAVDAVPSQVPARLDIDDAKDPEPVLP